MRFSRRVARLPAKASLIAYSFVGDLRAWSTHEQKLEKIASLRAFVDSLPAAFPMEGGDLVMGSALGYSVAMVRPFVESLLTAGAFLGTCVLFVKPEDTELIAYLRSRGITAVFFNARAYPVRRLVMARYFAYFDYLRSCMARGEWHRYILLSDVRDVIFQKPLFGIPCGELEFHYELARIGECRANSAWMRGYFGKESLVRSADRRISCSGTVSGRMRGILRYLAQMQMLMLALPDKRSIRGGDQGVHNYLFHSGYLAEAEALDNFARVATLHHVSSAEVHPNENGFVVNPDGTISEIAHQYDRHPHLTEAVSQAFKN